jgi:serine protease Do
MAAKPWYGTFFVNKDKSLYSEDISVDFMKSLDDANFLAVLLDDKTVLTKLDMKDSTPAIQAVVNCVRQHPNIPKAEVAISGTGFFAATNFIVTNNHVVKECTKPVRVRYPESAWYSATISGQDDTNDLALLHTDMKGDAVGAFRLQPRLGETVAVYGFPYADILSSSGNFTLGNVTSLSGLKDDTRLLQISSPVQPGNSGGPLLDMSGRVLGVVVSQLKILPDSVPQNVNFAIRAAIAINFLEAKGATLDVGTSKADLPPTEVADLAKRFTVQVLCGDLPPKMSTVGSSTYFLNAPSDRELGDLSSSSLRLSDEHWQQMNFFGTNLP